MSLQPGPVPVKMPWSNSPPEPHREYARKPWEWLPRPYAGRIMVPSQDQSRAERHPQPMAPIHVMIVPGPEGMWQIIRVELESPVARGFKTRERARDWIGRAIREGVLPQGVMEVEPPPRRRDKYGRGWP